MYEHDDSRSETSRGESLGVRYHGQKYAHPGFSVHFAPLAAAWNLSQQPSDYLRGAGV